MHLLTITWLVKSTGLGNQACDMYDISTHDAHLRSQKESSSPAQPYQFHQGRESVSFDRSMTLLDFLRPADSIGIPLKYLDCCANLGSNVVLLGIVPFESTTVTWAVGNSDRFLLVIPDHDTAINQCPSSRAECG
nr:hypothetical protein CFP56_71746 [Quercus suber]